MLAVAVSAQGGDGGGGYGKQPDGYFQYVNVPGHKEYEFGWNRGNPHHYISRYEQAKDHRFRTRVRRSPRPPQAIVIFCIHTNTNREYPT